jgi:trigger factor
MDFQSSVESIDEVTRKIVVVVGKERVAKEYQSSVKQVGRTAQVAGFRRGKVPAQMIERLMGDRIKYDITNKLINEGLRSAFETHNLNTIGQPQVDLKEMQTHNVLEFTATVEVLPEPQVSSYFDRSIEVEKREIEEADVAKALEQLTESRAQLNPIEGRTILESGDVVALSVSIKVDDGDFSQPEPFVDQIGSGRLSKQVEAQLVGLEVKTEKEIEIVGDDEHPIESIRGKKAVYKLDIHGIYSKILPAIDDDFAKSLDMKVETVAELNQALKTKLVNEAESSAKSDAQVALLELLVKENEFKIPQSLVNDEIRDMIARMGFANKGIDPENIDVAPFRQYFEEAATKRIKTAILVDRVGVQEGVKVEEADTKSMLAKIAEQNGVTVEVATKTLLDKSRRAGFLAEVRRTKILDMLMDKTSVKYVPMKKAEGEKNK